jgi:enoyl-CoA hydratase/carnithine racemase
MTSLKARKASATGCRNPVALEASAQRLIAPIQVKSLAMAPAYQTLELARTGPVLRVWLNRPTRRNAISPRMLSELGDLFLSLETDFDARVVVLGGRGASFCAGADRKAPIPEEALPPPGGERERRWLAHLGRRACRAIEACEVVTIARVHGHAIGGGCCLALSCDFRVAALDSVFRIPEVDLGVPLTWAAVPRLLDEIGAARTRELVLLCGDVHADQALAWGMVHRSVALEALDSEVESIVQTLLQKPELALHMAKTNLRGYAQLRSLGDASEADGDLFTLARGSADFLERFSMKPAPNSRDDHER